MIKKIQQPPELLRRKLIGLTGVGIVAAFGAETAHADVNNLSQHLKTPKDFGAIGDGINDDTIAVQKALDNGPCIIDADYAVTGLTCDNYITTLPQSKLLYIGPKNGVCLEIKSHFGIIRVDGNLSDVVGVDITGHNVIGDLIIVENVTAAETAETIYAVRINANGSKIRRIYTNNTLNTGAPNGSIPQAIGIVGTSDNTMINEIYTENGASSVVFGRRTGRSFIDHCRSRNMTDNGVYGLGGDNYINDFIYEGNEEAYVAASGQHTINHITTIGPCIGALELQSNGEVHVHTITIKDDGAGSQTASKAVLSRSTATNIGRIYVGKIEGTIRGNGIVSFSSGKSIQYLCIDKIDVILEYDNTSRDWAALNTWFDLSVVEQYNIGPSTIRIRDVNDVVHSTTIFTVKTGKPIRNSLIENFDVYFETSTGAELANGNCRAGTPTEFLKIKGAIWQTNIGPYAREANYLEGAMRDSALSIPLTGYWRKGQILWHADGNTKSFGFLCTKTGTPGKWASLSGT